MNCLHCYKPLPEGVTDFHSDCIRSFFGTDFLPIINLNQENITELAKQNLNDRVTIAGVQPKLSLNLKKNSNNLSRLTILGLLGDYILKPPTDLFPDLPANEHLTMHLATLSGLTTAKHSLVRLSSGELAYITQRFDRDKGTKLAMEDMCQLTENLTEHKYRGSVEMVGKCIKKYTTDSGIHLNKLLELVIFCFLTGNADMHLKNYSLIESGNGGFGLAPAYDLINTKIAMPTDLEESALTINAKKNKLNRNDFKVLANNYKINSKSFELILEKYLYLLPVWKTIVSSSFLNETNKEMYCDVIEERSKRLYS